MSKDFFKKFLMNDPLSRVAIKYKLPMTFVAVCLITFGVGGYIVASSAYHSIETEIIKRLESEVRYRKALLGKKLESLVHRTEDFSSDGFIRTSVQTLQQDKESTAVKQALSTHLRNNKLILESAFQGIMIIDKTGRNISKSFGGSQYSENPILLRKSESTMIGPLYKTGQTGDSLSFIISSPIRDIADQEIIGVLGNIVNFSRVLESIQESVFMDAQDFSGDAYLTVRGSKETNWYAPRWNISDKRNTELGFTTNVRNYEQSFSSVNRHYGKHTCMDGRLMYGRSFQIELTGWDLLVEIDATEALNPIQTLESRFLGTGIIIAILTVILLYFPIQFVVKPLVSLKEMAIRLKNGEFTVRNEIRSHDEIGHLSTAFNHMAEAIEQRTKNLQEVAADLKEQEEELQMEHSRLLAVVQSMEDGLVLINSREKVIVSNQAASPLLQLLNGANSLKKKDCGNKENFEDGCAQCLVRNMESTTCRVTIEKKIYEVISAPFLAEESGKVLVSRDITERELMQEKQSHHERLTVLGKLSAVVAHELNSPLAAISMYNQMLQSELDPDSSYQEHTDVIQRNTESCKQIIKELLNYARSPQPELSQVNIRELVTDILRFLRPIYENRDIQLEYEDSGESYMILGDRNQLQQVLVNLVMNAIQAIPETKEGQVKIAVHRSGGSIVIDVSDNGAGVSEEHQRNIFEPFYTTKKSNGTGLGLPTARRIIEVHKGEISLYTTGNEGTTFQIILPSEMSYNLQNVSSQAFSEPVDAFNV